MFTIPKKKSHLDSVFADKLSPPRNNYWELSSGVTFYRAPLSIKNSTFKNNASGDDLINIVITKFDMASNVFKLSVAIAVDIDFSNRKIMDTQFLDCGTIDSNGDCLDIAGSQIELQRIKTDGAGDKGNSVGERSVMIANDVKINNAMLAVAVKDASMLQINNITIDRSQYGLLAYTKNQNIMELASRLAIKLVTMPSRNILEKVIHPLLLMESSRKKSQFG